MRIPHNKVTCMSALTGLERYDARSGEYRSAGCTDKPTWTMIVLCYIISQGGVSLLTPVRDVGKTVESIEKLASALRCICKRYFPPLRAVSSMKITLMGYA